MVTSAFSRADSIGGSTKDILGHYYVKLYNMYIAKPELYYFIYVAAVHHRKY